MTEARLVTREQLAAALEERWYSDSLTYEYWLDQADAIFAALPAAAPAEGLSDVDVTLIPCAFQHPGWAKPCGKPPSAREHYMWDGWHYSGRTRHQYARAALARHESGSE